MSRWRIAAAKENLSELLRQAESEPQEILNRERLVAAVIDARAYQSFKEWEQSRRTSLAEAFAELRALEGGASYVLKVPARRNRRHDFKHAGTRTAR